MKPHITPIVIDISDDNIMQVMSDVLAECNNYSAYPIGKKHISIVPICLDTETTTIEKDGEQYAFTWIYQIQIGKYCLLIPKKYQLLYVLRALNSYADKEKIYLYMAIANVGYEWSFLCKDMNALSAKGAKTDIFFGYCDPLTAEIERIEIVDINRMTNSTLAKIGKDYCTTQKLKGDLDYKKIRNSMTIKHLTDEERGYCINDVVVGAEYMTFIHDRFTKNYKRIPLTSTGFIRQAMAELAYKTDENGDFVNQPILDEILSGYPKAYTEYSKIMNYLFRGGYTHGNCVYCGDTLTNVEHIDYTSFYPAMLLQNLYPRKFYREGEIFIYSGHKIEVSKFTTQKALDKLLESERDIAFYFTAEFYELQKTTAHSLESLHKVLDISENPYIDNGRIISAYYVKVMLTEQDYICYKKLYEWKELRISNLHIGIKKELPRYMIAPIVKAYAEKKRLKDLKQPYAVEKAMLNAGYGCTCQRIPIEDMREVYDGDEIKHITSPVKFSYLNVDTPKNLKYFGYVKQKLIQKYKFKDTPKLNEAILGVYSDLYNGIERDGNDNYKAIRETVIEKLQQRAYTENLRGYKIGNNYKSKFLSCWYGVYCTAYARRHLVDMIYMLEQYADENELQPIVVYYDTDSLFLNAHQTAECWNDVKSIIDYNNNMTEHYNRQYLREYEPSGLLDDIGLFTWEPTASHYKQLGAKRYLQRYAINRRKYKYIRHEISNGHSVKELHKAPKFPDRYTIEATVAGLNKKDFTRKVNKQADTIEEIFAFFTDGMTFEEWETSKLIPHYIAKPYSAEVTDEYGNTEIMQEQCGQVLRQTPFKMQLFGLLLEKIKERIG